MIKAKEAFEQDHPGLISLKNAGDQASQDQLVEVSTANQAKLEELEKLVKDKVAAYQILESKELENTRNQLAEIKRLESIIASANAERTTLQQQNLTNSNGQQSYWRSLLQEKDVELQRTNAQHLQERESQRMKIQAQQDDLNVQENAVDVETTPVHVCDHSRCIDDANLRQGQIRSLEGLMIAGDLRFSQLQTEANEQGLKMKVLEAQLEDQKAVIEKLQVSVVWTNDRDAEISELRQEGSMLSGTMMWIWKGRYIGVARI